MGVFVVICINGYLDANRKCEKIEPEDQMRGRTEKEEMISRHRHPGCAIDDAILSLYDTNAILLNTPDRVKILILSLSHNILRFVIVLGCRQKSTERGMCTLLIALRLPESASTLLRMLYMYY